MWLARDVELESYNNGKGIRMVIWNQGCLLHCPGCHNPETWRENCGLYKPVSYVEQQIWENKERHQGITLSGGDPFLQPRENAEIARYAHKLGLDVWAYCGCKFEDLIQNEETYKLLKQCDVLVDGPFIMAERDISLPFRGSRNQRIIDVERSLRYGEVVLLDI